MMDGKGGCLVMRGVSIARCAVLTAHCCRQLCVQHPVVAGERGYDARPGQARPACLPGW